MNRRQAALVLAFCLLPVPALAEDYVAAMVSELQGQGYDRIVVETTWLGRVQIHASRTDSTREVVLNPHTGEVLRDLRIRRDSDDDGADDRRDGDDDESDDNGGDDGKGDNDHDDDKGDDGGDNSGSGGGGDDD